MTDFNIRDLFPAFILADKNGYAMCRAIEAGLKAFDSIIEAGASCILEPDKMPAWRCDEMAWEYNLSWYDYGADIDTKRRQIAEAMDIYNILGTPDAVSRAIAAVFSDGTISEWFNYSGEPYHFSIYTTDVSAMTTNREKFMRILNAVKNLRSTLDNIYYRGAEGTAGMKIGTKATGSYGIAYATAQEG